jgi:hypothetical protein
LIDQRDPRPAMLDREVIGGGDARYAGADDRDLELLGGAQGETPGVVARSAMLC